MKNVTDKNRVNIDRHESYRGKGLSFSHLFFRLTAAMGGLFDIVVFLIFGSFLTSDAIHCGIRQTDRIAGGYEPAIGSWPWMVSLRAQGLPMHLCGGVLIHPRFVLTAAHCTFLFLPWQYEVHIGLHYINDTDHFVSPVKKIYLHPNYTSTVDFSQTVFDFAVLELVNSTENRFPVICLPSYAGDMNLTETRNATTLGWGVTGSNVTALSHTLQEATLVLLNSSIPECIRTADGPLIVNDTLQLCAGRLEGGIGTCGVSVKRCLIISIHKAFLIHCRVIRVDH